MTNKLPFQELNSETAITLRVIQGQVPSAREEAQLSQIARLCTLMTNCWVMNPEERPNVVQCCAEVTLVVCLLVISWRQFLHNAILLAVATSFSWGSFRL